LSTQGETGVRCPGCGSARVRLLCLPECTHDLGWPPLQLRVRYHVCGECKKVFYVRAPDLNGRILR